MPFYIETYITGRAYVYRDLKLQDMPLDTET
jgi:hypothetical protein